MFGRSVQLLAHAPRATLSSHFAGNSFKVMKWGFFLILSLLPHKAICADEDKKDDKKPLDFNEFVKKFNLNGQDPLAGIQDIVKRELKEGGSLVPVKDFIESGMPGQIGFGFLMGYSSGLCVKKVSKIVAFAVGGLFIAVQSLSYAGFIKVDYEGIQKKVESALDLNNDGKLDEKDAKIAYDEMVEVVGYQMPAGGGFTAGLLMGLRG